jgi:hypothetical protein
VWQRTNEREGENLCLIYASSSSATFLDNSYHQYQGVSTCMLKMTHKRKRDEVQNILYSSQERLNSKSGSSGFCYTKAYIHGVHIVNA